MQNGSQTDIVLLIVAGCLGMLILVVSIVLFVVYYQKKVLAQKHDFQKQLLSATVQVEERERERIAKNIHDDIGTLLSVIKMNLSRASRNAANKELVEELTQKNYQLIDESMQAVRGALRDLTPITLNKLGYVKALEELSSQINNSETLVIELSHEDISVDLPKKEELQLFRLTKELLNNIIKHANASRLRIGFHRIAKSYRLRIEHDGNGISNETVKKLSKEQNGLGLKSIESRAQLINAKVNYGAAGEKQQAFVEVDIVYER